MQEWNKIKTIVQIVNPLYIRPPKSVLDVVILSEGKNRINQLSVKEIAMIVVRVKAPLFYKRNPKLLEERVNDLLSKYSSIQRKNS